MSDIDINEYFPQGDYLRHEHLQGRAVKLVISGVIPKTVESEYGSKRALDLTFHGTDKIFTAFPKNARAIGDGYGPKVSGWIGKEIVLKPGRTSNNKATIDAEPVYEQVSHGLPLDTPAAPAPSPEPPSVPGIDEPSYPAEPPGSLPGPEDYEDNIPF